MKNLLTLLLLFNGIVAFAQVAPAQKHLPSAQQVKPLLQTRIDTLNNMRDTARKATPVEPSADTVYRHLPDAKENVPLLLINNKIIGNLNLINPNDVTKLEIKKDRDIPQNLFNLSRFGVVFIFLKEESSSKIKTRSFSEIKKWFGFKGKVKFAIDGYFIDDESLVIAKENIAGIDVVREKYNDPLSPVTINIWTLALNARKQYVAPRLPTDKPGVIYIRGLASK